MAFGGESLPQFDPEWPICLALLCAKQAGEIFENLVPNSTHRPKHAHILHTPSSLQKWVGKGGGGAYKI